MSSAMFLHTSATLVRPAYPSGARGYRMISNVALGKIAANGVYGSLVMNPIFKAQLPVSEAERSGNATTDVAMTTSSKNPADPNVMANSQS